MRRSPWLFRIGLAFALLTALGAAPRYLESLRIGGGYGDPDGGVDIDADGEIRTDGDIIFQGRLVAGSEGNVLTTSDGLLDAGALDIPAAQSASQADDADTLLIHDANAGATRKMTRADFLSGTGEQLWSDTGSAIQPLNAPELRIQNTGDVVLPGALNVKGPVSAGTATGNSYLLKAQFEGSTALASSSRAALEGHTVWSGGFHTASNIHGMAGSATIGSGYSASATDLIGAAGRVMPGPVFSTINRGVGVRGEVLLNQLGGMTSGMALHGRVSGTTGTVSNLYGLYLDDIIQGTTTNYAVYTGRGACRFGDNVTIAGDLELQGGNLSTPGNLSVSAANGMATLTMASSNFAVTTSQLQQQGQIRLHNITHPTLNLERTGTPAQDATLGSVAFRGLNSASTPTSYALISGKIQESSAGNESGQLEFRLLDDGTQTTALRLNGPDAFFDANASVAGALITSTLVTFALDDRTPSVRGANVFCVPGGWTPGHDVTQLEDGTPGQFVTIIGGDSDCVFADNANLHLAGPWTAHPDATLLLVCVGGVWYEISRSSN